jgi:hypothetical protein
MDLYIMLTSDMTLRELFPQANTMGKVYRAAC